MSEEVPPMAGNGAWLAEGEGTPAYIPNPDHVARLIAQGWQVVADPRLPVPVEDETKDEADQPPPAPLEGL